MQSLGKVVATSRRMPSPASLPSLRSENAGNDPTVSLVPSGGGGWKSSKDGKENQKEDGDTPPPPPPPPSQSKDVSSGDVTKGEGNRGGPHAPPPPPHLRRPPQSPGKQFKSHFPSLEEQETMSKKEFDDLHRRQVEGEGSPEPTGKWKIGNYHKLF